MSRARQADRGARELGRRDAQRSPDSVAEPMSNADRDLGDIETVASETDEELDDFDVDIEGTASEDDDEDEDDEDHEDDEG